MPNKLSEIKLVIFDVNQTMFSLKEIENSFKIYGLSRRFVDQWFLSVLKEGFSYTLSGKFIDFKTIGQNELQKIFLQKNIICKRTSINRILNSFSHLKIHNDVKKSLKLLKKNNLKIITLTNGSKSNTQILLKNNKIEYFIDRCFSIDQFKKWKPHKNVYLSTCELMNIDPKNTLMIAAHGWDINGAKLAGLKTAYITRYEKELSNFYLKPDYVGKDSFEIANKLFV